MSKLVKVGVITAAHGIRGEVKLKSLTENPRDIANYFPLTDETGNNPMHFRITGETAQGVLIASIENITTRNQAEALKNTTLYTAAINLPKLEDAYYPHELTGLQVVRQNGDLIGKVHAIHNFGAGDILEITYTNGDMEMFPFTEDFFPHVDTQITFIPPEILE